MSSHGVARTARLRTAEQRQQHLARIAKYRALDGQLGLRVADGQLDHDTFQLTSQLLRLNPEYYTVWNIRRRCLGPAGPAHQGHEFRQLDEETIKAELQFTVPLLVEYPKCYWIWKYRLWALAQATDKLPVSIARAIWEEELLLVAKMLHKDRRNFHAWGYRRHVVSQLESQALDGRSMTEHEFDYTTKKISEDLSNFSAWHNRSQLIPRLLCERGADDEARRELLDAVRQGINVDPEDQSLWYYHQFLVLGVVESRASGAIAPHLASTDRRLYLSTEIASIRELLEDYPDVKRVYEALVEYSIALWQLDGRLPRQEEREDVAGWLGKLRALDPKRNGRWDDLEGQLGFK